MQGLLLRWCLLCGSFKTGQASCSLDGSDASMTISISGFTRTLTSSGCPGFDWSTQTTPNSAEMQSYSVTMPTAVQVCKSTALDQIPYIDRDAMNSTNLGTSQPVMGMLGLALDGVPMYSPTDAEIGSDGIIGRNAVKFEGASLGHCGSHNTGPGHNHYHSHPGIAPSAAGGCTATCTGGRSNPQCNGKGILCNEVIPETAQVCTDLTSGKFAFYSASAQGSAAAFGSNSVDVQGHSPLLGFMADGVPIYGFLGVGGTEPSDLDACNGHKTDLEFYHYHATRTYPYLVKCLRGRLQRSTSSGWSNRIYGMSNSCASGYDTYDYSNIIPSWTYPVKDAALTLAPTVPIAPPTPAPPAQPNTRPNFIIFQPDDMPFFDDWGPPPNSPSRQNRLVTNPGLPYMGQIRSEGVSFSNAYVVSPACGTSRFATLTGKYPSRSEYGRGLSSALNRTKTTIPNTKLAGADCIQNVPSALQAAGYKTGVAGKWHLAMRAGGSSTAVPSYAEQQAGIKACGFDWADGIYLENMDTGSFASSGDFSHNMEWVTQKAVEFIEQSVEPFFLYFNPTVPHTPSVEAALNDFECTKTPSGTLSAEPQVDGMTKGTTCAAYRATILSRSAGSRSNMKEANLGSIWSDDALGALVIALTKKSILDNTLIAVTMDHGIETKGALFENGVRVALSVRYPPIASAGLVYNGLVSNLDLARTIVDLAQVVPAFSMDGQSWASEVEAAKQSGNPVDSFWSSRCIFVEYELDRALRCGCKKLIQIGDPSSSTTLDRANNFGHSTATWQLYDVCTEGGAETHNVYTESFCTTCVEMQAVLTCHEKRTSPAGPPGFGACGPSTPAPPSASAPTPAPPTLRPLVTPSPSCESNCEDSITSSPTPTSASSPTHAPSTESPSVTPSPSCDSGCDDDPIFTSGFASSLVSHVCAKPVVACILLLCLMTHD